MLNDPALSATPTTIRSTLPVDAAISKFEKEALEVTLEGRIGYMLAMTGRMRDACRGMINNRRVRALDAEDQKELYDAINYLNDAGTALGNVTTALFANGTMPTHDEIQNGTAAPMRERREPDGLPPAFE